VTFSLNELIFYYPVIVSASFPTWVNTPTPNDPPFSGFATSLKVSPGVSPALN